MYVVKMVNNQVYMITFVFEYYEWNECRAPMKTSVNCLGLPWVNKWMMWAVHFWIIVVKNLREFHLDTPISCFLGICYLVFYSQVMDHYGNKSFSVILVYISIHVCMEHLNKFIHLIINIWPKVISIQDTRRLIIVTRLVYSKPIQSFYIEAFSLTSTLLQNTWCVLLKSGYMRFACLEYYADATPALTIYATAGWSQVAGGLPAWHIVLSGNYSKIGIVLT